MSADAGLAKLGAAVRPNDSVMTRLLLGAAAILVAYHYSLLTLVRNLGLDTPLAYLGLVPIISVGIAMALPKPTTPVLDIHDRQLDLIVGLPLVLGTVVALHVLPVRMSTLFWTTRLDLLTLPVFVFGVGVLLFGLRTTTRYRIPILFLFLAWPYPYTILIDHTLQVTTDSTIAAIKQALHVFAVAIPAGGDGSLFRVVHGGAKGSFTVSIASACAGVNSLVGFTIVGTACLAVGQVQSRGRGVLRKLAWLALGLSLVWALNVVRLMLVLWAGKSWGKNVAIDGLHPVIGFFTFSGAVVVALLAMPLFGLQLGSARGQVEPFSDRWHALTSAPPAAAKGIRLAGISLVAATALLVGTNSSFAHYELVAGDLSSVRLSGFAQDPAKVPGFASSRTDSYDWVKQFFGSSATWDRFQYSASGTSPQFPVSFSSRPIIADVIQGKSLNPFNAYGIEACYQFHGFQTSTQQRVDLGHGVYGGAISFKDPRHPQTWNVVFWVWPVETPQGRRYERVALLQQVGEGSQTLASPDQSPLLGVGAAPAVGPAAADTTQKGQRAQLTAFARSVIANQSAAPTPATTIGTATGPSRD